MKASANSVTVASPDASTRMLNGGVSLSPIFVPGQLKPQARLTATSIKRAEESADCCGEADGTLRVPAGREERRLVEHRRSLLSQGLPVRKNVGLADISSCCTAVGGVLRNRAIFAALSGRAGALREDAKSHEYHGLGAHRRPR